MRRFWIILGLWMLECLGCQHQGTACNIVRTADDICTKIQYEDVEGNKHEVELTEDDVREVTAKAANRKGLAAPAPNRSSKTK